ncbi:nuclear transport factor 2 family protein [Streptomyces sp. SID13031]|uniref:nuclear transport factor 2 family protein n=1 Tax=Streptomyces sp. SID13031 TaxID=2706046 RepID=UPI0013CA7CB9|nr:nuclear transport factor 2 family protein [Streptomyces sp. SID13031]NEA37552.1 nuclear transport factor 2 family protein [Streptomyces sp. SID13031]
MTAGYLESPEALKDLRTLNARFIENFIRNDVESHDAILHPEFICVRSNGARINRESYLKAWATGFDPDVVIYWDVRDELITLIENVALVRSTNRHVIRCDGQDEAGMSTYTDTYLYQDGAWKCIQAQISPVAADREPGEETVISVYIHGVRQA